MKIFNALILSVLFAFAAFAQKQAEVIVVSTFMRQSPDQTSEKIRTLQKGEQVIFEKSQETNGWVYVSVENRTVKGWIRQDTIQRIADAKKNTDKPTATPIMPPTAPVESSPEITPPTRSTPTGVPPNVSPSPVPAATPNVIEDDEVIRVETEEVSLKVRVIDANNRTVKNLDQAQFNVYEDDVPQTVVSLTTAAVPVINALLIDNSRSLRAQLGKVIEAGKIIVNSNLSPDETTVVRFVSRDKIEVVQDFTANKNSLDNALDNLFVEGGQTAIIDAIYQTAKRVDDYQKSQKKEDLKIRALILVSDGDERGSLFKEQALFDLLRASQVQIFAIGFTGDLNASAEPNGISRQQKAKDFLTRLANETGGKVYFPAAAGDLPDIA
ncbi:MAG: VWA domain-containing protein, partial [Acidobacteriota bacterium]|nr:VWA domain-containing protein [Acidobacteriota bacterium]